MRTNRLMALLALCICLVLGTACAAGQSGQTQGDPEADSAQTAADPLEGIDADSRVVALSRSVGELWLLAGGQLVGVTDDAFDLAGLSEDAESIGTLTTPDLEQILALKPDLVMLSKDLPSHQEIYESLVQEQVPVLAVDVNSFDDYDEMMATLTGLTGRDDLYEQNVSNVRVRIDDILEHRAKEGQGTYLALRTSATKNKVLTSEYFACDMLNDLGLTNVADGTTAFDEPSVAAIAKADPDWIFVIYQGESGEAQKAFEEAFTSDPAWAELSAVKAGHVTGLPKNLFQYKPNARWADAYSYLSQSLNTSLA